MLLLLLLLLPSIALTSFSVSNNEFQLNGQKFQMLSGEAHYFRMPHELWRDRLTRLKAMGLNTISTYIPWNFHEITEGEFNFDGDKNFEAFISIAEELDLKILLRVGPYICAEWDFGGLPSFLLKDISNPMVLRTNDAKFISAVDKWFDILLPKIKGHSNVIMIQLENEFGSYGSSSTQEDKDYINHLLTISKNVLGDQIVYYATDPYFSTGNFGQNDLFAAVDFGPGPIAKNVGFIFEDRVNPPGHHAHFVSEYYTGWLALWGAAFPFKSTKDLASGLDSILSTGASVNLYMAFGGTNFEFWNGGFHFPTSSFQPHITSYDYNSPLSESGIHNMGSDNLDKFAAVQQVLRKYNNITFDEPAALPRKSYGSVSLKNKASLLDNLDYVADKKTENSLPLPMETFDQALGYISYCTTITTLEKLIVEGVKDRAHVIVNKKVVQILEKADSVTLNIPINANENNELCILVENQGRLSIAQRNLLGQNLKMFESKGLVSNGGKPTVLYGSNALSNWSVYTLPFLYGNLEVLSANLVKDDSANFPLFIQGILTITDETVSDTFIDTSKLGKGAIFVNGRNIGRYWASKGPQITLYVPAPYLVKGENCIVIFETDGFSKDFNYEINTLDTADLGKASSNILLK